MACKGTRVTKGEQKKMYLLYQELGSYKAVATKLRRNADTVSKHIAMYEAARAVANALTK